MTVPIGQLSNARLITQKSFVLKKVLQHVRTVIIKTVRAILPIMSMTHQNHRSYCQTAANVINVVIIPALTTVICPVCLHPAKSEADVAERIIIPVHPHPLTVSAVFLAHLILTAAAEIKLFTVRQVRGMPALAIIAAAHPRRRKTAMVPVAA